MVDGGWLVVVVVAVVVMAAIEGLSPEFQRC